MAGRDRCERCGIGKVRNDKDVRKKRGALLFWLFQVVSAEKAIKA